jgi:hypothetical protein
MTSSRESEPQLWMRYKGEDGKEVELAFRSAKPLTYSDLVITRNNYNIEIVGDLINVKGLSENGKTRTVRGNIKEISFRRPCSIYGLVEGGWLPLPFVGSRPFLVDRNVVIMLERIRKGENRQYFRDNEWWFSLWQKVSPTINPVLYAWEGDCRRSPTYDEFCDSFERGAEEILATLPFAKVTKFEEQNYKAVYESLQGMSERLKSESEFLRYASALILHRSGDTDLEKNRQDLVRKAKQLGLRWPSLVLVAVFSCLYESRDGSGYLAARRILKPADTYAENDAYNAVSDLRALELYMALRTVDKRIALATCDLAQAAFWCLLRPSSPGYSRDSVTFSAIFSTELFPRLSQEQLENFLDGWSRH